MRTQTDCRHTGTDCLHTLTECEHILPVYIHTQLDCMYSVHPTELRPSVADADHFFDTDLDPSFPFDTDPDLTFHSVTDSDPTT
jgi:hypothetical protein